MINYPIMNIDSVSPNLTPSSFSLSYVVINYLSHHVNVLFSAHINVFDL